MAKRSAEAEEEQETFKNGDRPMDIDQEETLDFEDEFEDEFESEDEIFEAGVDGRPDEEREAEERESMLCGVNLDMARP
jgi:ribosome assembly protein RRB1